VPYLDIILPIGLSFHTFQAMSYTIEVYRGKQPAERHFGLYSLYVMFYPQLVAGPIERPQNVLHQFKEVHYFDTQRAVDGLKLMAWGMFKKVVIADRLAVLVNQVYDTPEQYTGLPLLIATFFFAIQIYCDFSGYSDIALGSARVMGFDLMRNFNAPYLSKSIAEFWRRWHISLSTWFRDYLYIPLGGNRVALSRQCFNLFFVFLVSGFWHGANWTFIVWGGLHGLYLAISLLVKRLPGTSVRIPSGLSDAFHLATTFGLVCITWIFFRANSVSDAIYILTHMEDGVVSKLQMLPVVQGDWFKDWMGFEGILNFGKKDLVLSFLLIIMLMAVDALNNKVNLIAYLKTQRPVLRFTVYTLLALLILIFGEYSNQGQFIYFQF
jgi:D-alanyl-lipoteichoic acid acyltransferase DltB (MBOAT superfamily)